MKDDDICKKCLIERVDLLMFDVWESKLKYDLIKSNFSFYISFLSLRKFCLLIYVYVFKFFEIRL